MDKREIKDEFLVVKSNALIHFEGNLTALEQKIVISVISLIKPTDINFRMYKLSISQLAGVLGINKKVAYRTIDEAVEKLMKKIIYIPNEDKKPIKAVFFASCEYKTGEGAIEVELSSKLLKHLIMLKGKFTSYYLYNITKLKSKYAIRLYEMLKSYNFNGCKNVIEIDIEEFKREVNAQAYTTYTKLVDRVIKPSIKEINTKTDLLVSFKPKKTGKKNTHIIFTIEKNTIKQDMMIETFNMDSLVSSYIK